MRNRQRTLGRRDFIKYSVAGLAVLPKAGKAFTGITPAAKTKVVLVKTADRTQGVKSALATLEFPSPGGKRVFIKPNFNTADPAPGSTHNDTLAALIRQLKSRGAAGITVGERSGPPATRQVMEDKGIFALSNELGFEVVNFEDMSQDGWVAFNPPGNHWKDGFSIPKPVVEAEYIVSTCCLKTHQYGGVITMSLKLAVGLTPKNLMRQLHQSPDQRKMIAEINLVYKPQLILMDGVEAFVDGGPSTGKKVDAGVVVAGTDRVAVDSVGVAILKQLGSNEAIMSRKILEQEQILRAVELGLGVAHPSLIEIIAPDKASEEYAGKIRPILAAG